MKKVLLIVMLAFAGTTFANAFTKSDFVNMITPIANNSYSLNELISTNAAIEYTSLQNIQSNANRRLPHGDVTDGDGNVVGWWAYDGNSGVLLIYLY
ncbi:hypothetical protein [Pedobacter sp. UYP1]|jgi:hypothetical protein|uniref:hypothetical protein n=1 Tax=Pedobacter sp. UYP1 TaxID=1756396 RepID=UPI00339A7512